MTAQSKQSSTCSSRIRDLALQPRPRYAGLRILGPKANLALTELQSAAVKGAIASAIFVANADNELLEALTRMNELVDDFNRRLRKTTENILDGRGGTRIEWRRKLRDSMSYRTTKDHATSLLAILVKRYGLDPNRQFFGTQETRKEGEATPR